MGIIFYKRNKLTGRLAPMVTSLLSEINSGQVYQDARDGQ